MLRWWRSRKARRAGQEAPQAVHLAPVLADLTVLAQLLAGRAITVCAAEAEGGVHRDTLRLPTRIAMGADAQANAELYVLRTVIEATRLRFGPPTPTGDALCDRLAVLAQVQHVLAHLTADFAGFLRRLTPVRAWLPSRLPPPQTPRGAALRALELQVLRGEPIDDFDAALARLRAVGGAFAGPITLWGAPLPPSVIAAIDDAQTPAEPALGAVTTEHAAPPRDHVERLQLPTDDDAEILPFHTFEKVECLDEHSGGARRMDGSDELDDHLDALDEVDMRHIVRGGPPAESVLRAEIEGLTTIPDVDHLAPGETGIAYDEWHQRAGRYRKNWVTVYPSLAPTPPDSAWSAERLAAMAPLRRRLLHRLEGMRQARRWTGRQLDGDAIDLAAWVEAQADRRAGRAGSLRLYRRNPRRARDVATLVLIDQSLSSDAWVADRRVLDVSRDAVLLLGEVANALGDRLAVHTFASNTRNRCRVWQIKGWREPWSLGRARLGGIVPSGYTRIGPALRHATAQLARVQAEQKLLLLITDGKPNDYDRYEGRYGMADVRQATREAARLGVEVYAIGIDPSAARTLPEMFGTGASQVLRALDALPEICVEAYGRLR